MNEWGCRFRHNPLPSKHQIFSIPNQRHAPLWFGLMIATFWKGDSNSRTGIGCLLKRHNCFPDEGIVNGAEGVHQLWLSRWYVRHIATTTLSRLAILGSSFLISQPDADHHVLGGAANRQ
jgi:hypothetical protein